MFRQKIFITMKQLFFYKRGNYIVLSISILMLFLSMSKSRDENRNDVNYKWNMVPDSATATKIAEIVLKRTFDSILISKDRLTIEEQMPFEVFFIEDKKVWMIYGKRKENQGLGGGGVSIQIDMKTGKINDIGIMK